MGTAAVCFNWICLKHLLINKTCVKFV